MMRLLEPSCHPGRVETGPGDDPRYTVAMSRLPTLLPMLLLPIAALLLACGPEPKTPDMPVIVIVVDTLRADRLGIYGYGRDTSPELDDWARGARVYQHAFATSSWTLPSMGSLLTGRLPSEHAAGTVIRTGAQREFGALGRRERGVLSLATRLREAGYQTAAIVNNRFLDPRFGVARGFDHYDHAQAHEESSRRADEVVDLASQWLESAPRERFFLLLHLFDPHLNYDAPAPYAGRFTRGTRFEGRLPVDDLEGLRERAADLPEAERRFVGAAYDEEVAFVDAQLGRLRRKLESLELADRALVILTSDHGEELFEHGGFEHGHEMWQELLQVPLLVWGPGVRAGQSQTPVSLVDVVPTVLEALGLETGGNSAPASGPDSGPSLDGVSLWPELTGGPSPADRLLYAEGTYYGPERVAVFRWPYKLVRAPATGQERLIDLGADASERSPLVGERPEVARALAAALDRRQARAIRRHPLIQVDLDDELRARLKAMGYAN